MQLPVGLTAQSGIAEVMGSNPVQVFNFATASAVRRMTVLLTQPDYQPLLGK